MENIRQCLARALLNCFFCCFCIRGDKQDYRSSWMVRESSRVYGRRRVACAISRLGLVRCLLYPFKSRTEESKKSSIVDYFHLKFWFEFDQPQRKVVVAKAVME